MFLTFALLLVFHEVRDARSRSKTVFTDTVITARCVDASCIFSTVHLSFFAFVDIYLKDIQP